MATSLRIETRDRLFLYEEAIQLHFDEKLQIAWLTLKNYGHVFHAWEAWSIHCWMDVTTVTIGIPAGTFTEDEALLIAPDNNPTGMTAASVLVSAPNPEDSISISAYLDAVDVIQFQLHILEAAHTYSHGSKAWVGKTNTVNIRTGYARKAMFMLLQQTFEAIRFPDVDLREANPPLRPRAGAYRQLIRLLHDEKPSSPAAPWIAEQIRKNARTNTGLTAFFPVPYQIVQEQRTLLIDRFGGRGKSKNQDMRSIDVMYGRPNNAIPIHQARGNYKNPEFKFEEFLDEIDKDRARNEEEFLRNGDRIHYLDRKKFGLSKEYLHKKTQRIDCYVFRGDAREPGVILNPDSGGFKAGVTRTDKGAEKYAHMGAAIDKALADTSDIGGKKYREALKNLDILTLGVFTGDPEGRAYISTTTSTAIAKYFAAEYYPHDKPFPFKTYCYAVHCKAGFYLPTPVPDAQEDWNKEKFGTNALTHFAEHEVAAIGAIWPEDIMGMRVIRVDQSGQYFAGPVFLKEVMRSDFEFANPNSNSQVRQWLPADDNAFYSLFNLFSGESQGTGYQIEWSYEQAPFDIFPEYMTGRGKSSNVRTNNENS